MRTQITCFILFFTVFGFCQKPLKSFTPGELWLDNSGKHINAHGGGIIFYANKYYWFGECKSDTSNLALSGVSCYSSNDLYNWKNEGIAMSVVNDEKSQIVKGCVIERPKVVYNKKTKTFVMWFHLELKEKGYSAALAGIATSKNVTGPFQFIRSFRSNPGNYPLNMSDKKVQFRNFPENEWWTPEWKIDVKKGMFVKRDLPVGQMSRDMTVFVDENEKAYHIYSSEENLTLHIAELTDDYLGYTGKYIRVAPGGHNEAPAIFKKGGRYFLITSGCTGWDPNAARMFSATDIMGNWTSHSNPFIGKDADKSFYSQGTYILNVVGKKKDTFIFMADRWTPKRPSDGRYIWLPIQFKDGLPILKHYDKWDLNIF